jgi:NADH:ubiquinone oxidoreductase subunit
MGAFKNIFTWWEGATFGTWLTTKRSGEAVGDDLIGNIYYQSRRADEAGRKRRWVIYAGPNDASRVPPEWHGWLHNTLDDIPDRALPAPRSFEKPATANLTGSAGAYRPAGAFEKSGTRAAATGDYQAWSPDQS